MIEKPSYNIPTLSDIRLLPITNKRHWPTKSNGYLNVLFSINFDDINKKFFHYENSELSKVSTDIRGLRSYRINGLQNKAFGANEWHKIRNELVFVIRGSVKWICEDIHGNCQKFILKKDMGIWVPPFILHTYEARQNDTELLVIANTLFMPDDPSTHDSFSVDSFRKLQIMLK